MLWSLTPDYKGDMGHWLEVAFKELMTFSSVVGELSLYSICLDISHKGEFPDRESNPGRGGESAES